MKVICLVFDRLHLGYLGAFGNGWIETPALDRFAAEGFCLDRMFIDSPDLTRLYDSYWLGRHAMAAPEPRDPKLALAELLSTTGVRTTLLADEPLVLRHPLAKSFDRIVELEPGQASEDNYQNLSGSSLLDSATRSGSGGAGRSEVADDVEGTHLARCFSELIDLAAAGPGPSLVWCHFQGLGGAWDAPMDFRLRYVETDDPDEPAPPSGAEVPNLLLPEGYDPDQLLGISQAYSGQITLLDDCIGALEEFLRSDPAYQETMLVLLSARGFPLAEHRRIGAWDDALYSELVHVPCIVRFPGGQGGATRSQALVEPSDLGATLLDCFGAPQRPGVSTAKSWMPLVRGEVETLRDRLCIAGPGPERALVTPAWYLRSRIAQEEGTGRAGGAQEEGTSGDRDTQEACTDTPSRPELFVCPDDRWQFNDVADRANDVVEQLQVVLDQTATAIREGRADQLPPLDDVLRLGME